MAKIVPLNDKIVVKRVEAEAKTSGGIVIPDATKEKPREGIVKSLGDGKRLEDGKRSSFQIKKGDRILFSSYAGTEIEVGGEKLLIMTEDDVLAILE